MLRLARLVNCLNKLIKNWLILKAIFASANIVFKSYSPFRMHNKIFLLFQNIFVSSFFGGVRAKVSQIEYYGIYRQCPRNNLFALSYMRLVINGDGVPISAEHTVKPSFSACITQRLPCRCMQRYTMLLTYTNHTLVLCIYLHTI